MMLSRADIREEIRKGMKLTDKLVDQRDALCI